VLGDEQCAALRKVGASLEQYVKHDSSGCSAVCFRFVLMQRVRRGVERFQAVFRGYRVRKVIVVHAHGVTCVQVEISSTVVR
jgi:hypothetical protein